MAKGKFTWIKSDQSGVELHGQIRDIVKINGEKNNDYLLFLQNDEYPVLYKMNKHSKTNAETAK